MTRNNVKILYLLSVGIDSQFEVVFVVLEILIVLKDLKPASFTICNRCSLRQTISQILSTIYCLNLNWSLNCLIFLLQIRFLGGVWLIYKPWCLIIGKLLLLLLSSCLTWVFKFVKNILYFHFQIL